MKIICKGKLEDLKGVVHMKNIYVEYVLKFYTYVAYVKTDRHM